MPTPITLLASDCPNAQQIAAALDMSILEEPDFSDDEHPQIVGRLYFIGTRGEKLAGLHPSQVTPVFKSLAELEAFCTEHREHFDMLAGQDDILQKLFWEK